MIEPEAVAVIKRDWNGKYKVTRNRHWTALSTRTIVPTGTWVVDQAHSRPGFAINHMGIATVCGEFKEFQGTWVSASTNSGERTCAACLGPLVSTETALIVP